MNEGQPSRTKRFSWAQKLSKLFLEPQDQDQLIDLIRSASERHILDSEALAIVEGALNVAQMKARDIIIPIIMGMKRLMEVVVSSMMMTKE